MESVGRLIAPWWFTAAMLAMVAGPAIPATPEIKEDTVGIARPSDPKALAAFEFLDKHCARCHQYGKLTNRLQPAKNFGNVLDLEQIARDPNLIRPGNPDASRIYKQVVKKEMPYDTYYEFSGTEPTTEEVAALREWIENLVETEMQLSQAETQRIDKPKFTTNEEVVVAIATDLRAQSGERVRGTRYLTLVNHANDGASEEELEVHRHGIVKLLNSTSRSPQIYRATWIDEQRTILKFNLDDLGWEASDWERLLSMYPYAVQPNVKQFDFIRSVTGTDLAFIRADWAAYATSRPPLYYDLLGLSDSFDELVKSLGIDIEQNIERSLVKRSGFQASGVSRNNRLIERHSIENGAFWTSYDFAGNKGSQNLFEHPLGPDGQDAFKHDNSETVFSLPNGFNAYYMSTPAGIRLDNGPTEIIQDTTQKNLTVTVGVSCLGCHDQGFRKTKDEIRAHVENESAFSTELQVVVTAIYPTHDEMDRIIDNDRSSFRAAMVRAGLDPDLKFGGIEMINMLSKRYEGDLTLRLAAAELGLTEDEFAARLQGAGGEGLRVKLRLEEGTIPRDTFELSFKGLVAAVTDDTVVKAKGAGEIRNVEITPE